MPGTKAGAAKTWEKRRARYGESGLKPQTLDKRHRSAQSANKRKAAPSSRNSNKAARTMITINGQSIPVESFNRHDLEQMIDRRETVLSAIRRYDRDRASGKKAPAPYIAEINKANHAARVRELRKLDEDIARLTDDLLRRERAKHGRRYTK